MVVLGGDYHGRFGLIVRVGGRDKELEALMSQL